MLIKLICISSNISVNRVESSSFVQKPFLRTKSIEINSEEDIDLKIHYGTKSLKVPNSIVDAASKNYVDKLYKDPSRMKNDKDIDLKDK